MGVPGKRHVPKLLLLKESNACAEHGAQICRYSRITVWFRKPPPGALEQPQLIIIPVNRLVNWHLEAGSYICRTLPGICSVPHCHTLLVADVVYQQASWVTRLGGQHDDYKSAYPKRRLKMVELVTLLSENVPRDLTM